MPSGAFDVVILGGGVAGLAAAGALAGKGLRIALLEGRERIGGRIRTIHLPGCALPIELGAEFIHGEAEQTLAIADRHALRVDELPDDHLWLRGDRFEEVRDFWGDLTRVRRKIRGRNDRSFSRFLESQKSLSPRLRSLARTFVEGYHAADPDRISALALAAGDEETAPGQNRQFRISPGYGALVTALRGAIDADVRLSTIVRRVEWRRGSATIRARTASGEELPPMQARTVIVTLPIGVLKAPPESAAAVAFEPKVEPLERAIVGIESGNVVKVVFRLREMFWSDPAWLRSRVRGERTRPAQFLHAAGETFPTWWTAAPARAPFLTGWAGGPGASALAGENEKTIASLALASLARICGLPKTRLERMVEAIHYHDWTSDPFSRGAYSWVAVGGLASQKRLSRPVEETIIFAGEATNAEESGTVAGAIDSGRRAAKQAMDVFTARI